MRILGTVLAMLLMAACLSCSGGGPAGLDGDVNGPTLDTGLLGLVSPGELPEVMRTTSPADPELIKLGAQFDDALPSANVEAQSTRAAFAPTWEGGGIDGLGFAMYRFYTGPAVVEPWVHLVWQASPGSPASVHFGLSNWDSDSWDWFQSESNTLTVDSFDPYLNDNDEIVVVIVLAEEGMSSLGRVVIGQPQDIEGWQHSWGPDPSGLSEFYGVASDNIDSLYFCGKDGLLFKYSMDGTFQWARQWNDTGSGYYQDVTIGSDGTIYVLGGTNEFGEGNQDLLIQAWSPNGFLSWTRTWGTAELDIPRRIVFADNSLYILGEATQGGALRDGILLKYGTGGNLFWAKAFGDEEIDSVGGLCVTHPSPGTADVHVTMFDRVDTTTWVPVYLRFDGSGSLVASKTWDVDGGGDPVTFSDVCATSDSSRVFIVGEVTPAGSSNRWALLEYTDQPDPLAMGYYEDSTWSMARQHLAIDDEGTILIAGDMQREGNDSSGIALTLSFEGTIKSSNNFYEGTEEITFYDSAFIPDFGWAITGYGQTAVGAAWQGISMNSQAVSGSWADMPRSAQNAVGVASAQEAIEVIIDGGVHDTGNGSDNAVAILITNEDLGF